MSWDWLSVKMVAHFKKTDYNKAWKYIEKAIALQPENSEMLMTHCKIYKEKGLIEEAKEDAERGMDLATKEGKWELLTEFRRLQEELSKEEEPDKTLIDFSVGKETFWMVKVKGGTFMMGETAEQRYDAFGRESLAHQVTLGDYYIGETVVTQELWKAVMGNNPSNRKGDNLPVEMVSWEDAQIFIKKLNQETVRTFRLPTEAEWEFAARGGKNSWGYKYSGSDNLDEVAWYEDNSGGKTHPVKGKKANELGLYDMSGNVWEWCQDWFGGYSGDAQSNPQGPTSGSGRVLRGGGWGSYAGRCRVSSRYCYAPVYRNGSVGFRLVMCP